MEDVLIATNSSQISELEVQMMFIKTITEDMDTFEEIDLLVN